MFWDPTALQEHRVARTLNIFQHMFRTIVVSNSFEEKCSKIQCLPEATAPANSFPSQAWEVKALKNNVSKTALGSPANLELREASQKSNSSYLETNSRPAKEPGPAKERLASFGKPQKPRSTEDVVQTLEAVSNASKTLQDI